MIGFAAEGLMELEVGGLTGAAWGEKSPDRLVSRNGYRDRDLDADQHGRLARLGAEGRAAPGNRSPSATATP